MVLLSRSDYPEQVGSFDFDCDGEYEAGESSEHEVSIGDGVLFIDVEMRGSVKVTAYSSTLPDDVVFWAGVDWCREYGVPGVYKESYWFNDNKYRLGALYLIRGFELTERETDYNTYGERQFGYSRDE